MELRRNSLITKGTVGLGILNPSAKLHVTLPIILTRKYSADAESALHYKIKRILSWRFRYSASAESAKH
jgi:hypothetical protein